jgi:hypothetical protein
MNEEHYKKVKCFIWLPAQINISNIFADNLAVDIFKDNIVLEEIPCLPKTDDEDRFDQSPLLRGKNKK